MLSMAFLVLMSLLAGILTGIIGMASLTLYPVLVSIGVPAISANATITVATVGAGIGTTMASLRELHHHWKAAFTAAILCTSGSVIGALILNASFKKVVPLFIFAAGIMLLWPSKSSSNSGLRKGLIATILGWIGVALIGIYNGYFGAASGLLMIAVLSKVVGGKYVTYNSIRNFSSFCSNVVSAIMFSFMLKIQWNLIIPLLIGLFIGGYIGPVIARHIPEKLIKTSVGIFALILAGILTWQAY